MKRFRAKSPSTQSLRKNIRRTLRLNWEIDRSGFIAYCLLAAAQIAGSLVGLYLASRIIGELSRVAQNQPVNSSHVYGLLLFSTLAILVERLAWRGISTVERRSWIKWYMYMVVNFNRHYAKLDLSQHHDPTLQKRLQKLTQDYQYLPNNFSRAILECLHSIARLVSSLIVVFTFAPWVVVVLCAALVPSFLAERRLSKMRWNLWGERGDKPMLAWRTTYYLQDKHKLQETKIFQTQNHLLELLRSLLSDFYDRQIMLLKSVQRRLASAVGVEVLTAGLINLWLIRKVLNHSLSLANYSFYTGVIFQVGSSLSLIVGSLTRMYDDNEYMRDLYLFFDLEPAMPMSENPVKVAETKIPRIVFEDVSFRYPGSKNWALRHASFTIEPGDKVAFVGENGAGKTTIIKLLLRFYDCDEGRILVNDTDVRELDLSSYYTHIGVLFQNFNDYPFSVRDNIAIGRVSKFNDDAAVHKAARMANATDFIDKYPEKYDQILEVAFEKGIEPSGGQWQRIALARALFRDAGILILDEPTAAVDAKSEYEIFKTLENNSAHKTTIVISHRFSTVRRANTIFVIKDGQIIEQGSHNQLIKIKDGLYQEMFNKQAEGYR